MQAVYMPYRPKKKTVAKDNAAPSVQTSPFVQLSKTNVFSHPPCANNATAVAYSKGKLSAMPEVAWDKE